MMGSTRIKRKDPRRRVLNEDEQLVRDLCFIDHGLTDKEIDTIEELAVKVLDEGNPLTTEERDWCLELLSE